MEAYDASTIAALQSGALILRDFLYVRGWDPDGDPIAFGFWRGEDNITLNVVSAVDGSTESRSYTGGGTLLRVPPIPRVIGLEARVITVSLSQIHAAVQDMVRGNTIRGAVAEVHRGLFSPATGAIVSTPFPRFLGKVQGAPVPTPAAGGEAPIELKLVSNTIELTRINTARKSDAQQSLRSGDTFRQYADTAGQFDIRWGEVSGTAASSPAAGSSQGRGR